MKNIKQILAEAGIELTDEQEKTVNTAVGENYKTIADYQKQVKKLGDKEQELEALQGQYDEANTTIEGLESKVKDLSGVDAKALQDEIETWKKKAEEAEGKAQKQILMRDQADFLKSKFDELGISSERTRKSLMEDIMGTDGLKWKDGSFLGLNDYLEKENEKDHFYMTAEEKEKAAGQGEAEEKRVKPFTTQAVHDDGEKKDPQSVFNFKFTPLRKAE